MMALDRVAALSDRKRRTRLRGDEDHCRSERDRDRDNRRQRRRQSPSRRHDERGEAREERRQSSSGLEKTREPTPPSPETIPGRTHSAVYISPFRVTREAEDVTESNMVDLRRAIYLTIMSSVDFEEAGHKLMELNLESDQEKMELCVMLLECCSQERTYVRYYGSLGQRLCTISRAYQESFERCFVQQYSAVHRLETNRLRNVARFFAHLLGTNAALPWSVLACVRLTEEDTTSSSRIFIKILFQELCEYHGIGLLSERLNDPRYADSIFPKDQPKNTRFAINFFTSIGLGGVTESIREHLRNMSRLTLQRPS